MRADENDDWDRTRMTSLEVRSPHIAADSVTVINAQVVASHHDVNPVLGQCEYEIHDRERKQHVRVDEHSGHEQ